MKLEIVPVKFIEIVHGDVVIQLSVQTDASLVGPAPGNVLYCVAASTKDKKGKTPRLNKSDAVAMAFDCGVVVAKPVVGE